MVTRKNIDFMCENIKLARTTKRHWRNGSRVRDFRCKHDVKCTNNHETLDIAGKPARTSDNLKNQRKRRIMN